MAWITERLTSILYGAAAGIAVSVLSGIGNDILVGGFVFLAMATEVWRGYRGGDR